MNFIFSRILFWDRKRIRLVLNWSFSLWVVMSEMERELILLVFEFGVGMLIVKMWLNSLIYLVVFV